MAEFNKKLKQFEKGQNDFDLQKESLANNEFLKNYGKDKFTFKPENTFLTAQYYRTYEAPLCHGYPATMWLQMGIVFGCGLYTAKE